MIQGTTPTHTFNIPFDTSTLKEVKVLYAQNDALVLEKHTSDCKLNGKTISVALSQEDTFLFDRKKPIEIQIRVLTLGGDALASIPTRVGVVKCLETEVLS